MASLSVIRPDDNDTNPPTCTTLSDSQKYQHLKNEILNGLNGRIGILQRMAEDIHRNMESMMFRIEKQGPDARMDDLKSGSLYQLTAQVKVLQELKQFMESLE